MLAIISSINIVGVTFISGVILIVGAAVTIGAVPIIGTVGTVIIGAAFIVGAAVTIGATVTALVRGAALRTLMQVLMLVKVITPSNASTFPKYIFPNLYKDPDVFVRCTLAQCVAPLSGTSVRYLEMGQAIKGHGSFKLAHTDEYDDALHETIVGVAGCVGGRNLEEYIFPVMMQALSDDEETVVARVLSLCELGRFQRMRLWELMSDTLGFLYHANIWIREGASAFIAGETKNLPSTDVWCILYPSLKHFLRSDLRSISERILLLTLKTPFSRQVFEAAVLWAMKTDKTNFWKAQCSKDNRELLVQLQTGQKTLRDYIIKLSNVLSRTGNRDYIIKPPNVLSSFATPSKEPEPEAMAQMTSGVELQKLSVVPQTIFIATRPSEVSTKTGSSRRLEHMNHFDDLGRRPAVINLSFSSLIIHGDRERAPSMSSVRPSSIMPPPPPNPPENRPSSPSVSVVSSTIDGSSSRTRPHLHMGSTDYQKAPAAVGSVKANATGLLVAPSVSRMGIEVEEDDTVLSGRSSPVSNVGTVWAGHRSVQSTKSISMRFNINTLGQLYDENSREAMVDFVPKVHEGPEASVDQIGNLISHSATVNGTAVAPDYAFFVTCSDEGMVLIEPWDIETTSLAETYETRESSPDTSTSTVQIGAAPSVISGIEAEKNPAAAIAALVRSRTALSSPDGATPSAGLAGSTRSDACIEHIGEGGGSVLKTGGGGFIVTGSEERKLRPQDPGSTERSTVLTGFDIDGDRASFSTTNDTIGSETITHV
ncbi:hypothetical protein BU17DRAFT_99144 [Hysterangium stoloniferum]|nr:hypothetical protein BU17DRAFT_99144 [Hysterangium stoloniferum]